MVGIKKYNNNINQLIVNGIVYLKQNNGIPYNNNYDWKFKNTQWIKKTINNNLYDYFRYFIQFT